MKKEIIDKAIYIKECLKDEDDWDWEDEFNSFIITELYYLLELIIDTADRRL